jgi:hypothetical protein
VEFSSPAEQAIGLMANWEDTYRRAISTSGGDSTKSARYDLARFIESDPRDLAR